MKRTIIISCAIACTFSLGAFGFIEWGKAELAPQETACSEPLRIGDNPLDIFKLGKDPGFIYDVNPRFLATITLEKLQNAQSISDLVPENATEGMSNFTNVKIGLLTDQNEIIEFGKSEQLNPAQRKLLQTINYSNNFYVKASCEYANARNGRQDDYDFVYYVSVVPERPAEYKYGQDGLLYYLEEKSRDAVKDLDLSKLNPGKLKFTITSEGKLTNIQLESSSGKAELDKVMLEALKSIPQEWTPATNQRGEKVDQVLVFSYGIMGC